MLTIETIVYIVAGICAIGFPLIGVIWSLHREEIKAHTEELKTKADQDKMLTIETRLEKDIERLKSDNEKLINKIEQKHEKELDQMESRLGSKMEKLESNLMAQMSMIMQLLQNRSN